MNTEFLTGPDLRGGEAAHSSSDTPWRRRPSPVASGEVMPETPCWDLDQLAHEAVLHSRRIDDQAKAVTIDYWRLGCVLELARGNFDRGKWGPWLADRGVSPDRASHARALARAFVSPGDFADLSVENAVRAARRILGKTTAASPADRNLRRQLSRLRKTLRSALPKLNASPASKAACCSRQPGGQQRHLRRGVQWQDQPRHAGRPGQRHRPEPRGTLPPHLVSGPSHDQSFQLNPDGSFHYVAAANYLGNDTITYYDTDSLGYSSNTATVTFSIQYSVVSSANITKAVAIDPLDTSVQILGSASGAPATPQNFSLAYDSVAGQPDAVIEATFQMNSITPIPDTPSATLTFNGVQQPATYVNLEGMGNQPNVDISEQVDVSDFTSAGGNSFTHPHGPLAFDTLTSVNGGGWQLLDKFGNVFNFNSGGFETSRVDRNTEVDTYNWSGNNLVSIIDPFSRTVNIGNAGGQLSSVADFAGKVWSIAHTGALLSSVTEPNPGGGSPVWQYGYSGNYLSSETDPNGNAYAFTLDSHHRLIGTSLPGGGSTSASSEQSMAYGGPIQQGAPNVTPSGNVVTTVTDANGNTTSLQTDVFGNPLV